MREPKFVLFEALVSSFGSSGSVLAGQSHKLDWALKLHNFSGKTHVTLSKRVKKKHIKGTYLIPTMNEDATWNGTYVYCKMRSQ